MLDAIGLSTRDEAVYRTMVEQPNLDVEGIAKRLSVEAQEVRRALDSLVELALVRVTESGGLRAVRPTAGLASLLAKAEAEIALRQRQIEATRAAVAAIASAYDDGEPELARRLIGAEAVRDRLAELEPSTQTEVLSFSQRSYSRESVEKGIGLNQRALERGVSFRNLYPEAFRNHPGMVEFARRMNELGSRSRTVPALPMLLVILDRRIAFVPIDPGDPYAGALELASPGVVTALVALFEQLWATGTPFGEAPSRDDKGLTPQERELLSLLARGHTDESAGRQLAISTRSVQRMMTALTERLSAASRFQAGVEASRQGWV